LFKRDIKVVSFIGYSGSGKTKSIISLINFIIKNTNYSVFVLKNIHHHLIDSKGKDSYKFSEAGADVVITKSDKQTTFFLNKAVDFEEIFDWLENLPIKPDIIITEGFRKLNNDKVLCVANYKDLEDQLDNSIKIISGKLASKVGKDESNYKGIPIINALLEPEKIIKILCPTIF
jgi:molybdopterin-guanine dinucleotide biosynthesis protein B